MYHIKIQLYTWKLDIRTCRIKHFTVKSQSYLKHLQNDILSKFQNRMNDL